MTPSELADVLAANAATPLRLYLAGGTTVNVDVPGRTVIRDGLLHVNADPDRPPSADRRPRVVSIAHVEMIEPRQTPPGTL